MIKKFLDNRFCMGRCGSLRKTGLHFERVEPRMMLAGDVTVFVDAGRLFVQGDAASNLIQIVGTPGGNATVSGLENTTINGSAGPFNANSRLIGVTVQLGSGDDQAMLSGLVFGSDIYLQGGSGNDNFEIRNSATSWFNFDGGDGNDILKLDNLYAARASSIFTGGGDDIVSINAHATGSYVEIMTGDGNDLLVVNDLQMRRQLQVDMGRGNDQVLMAGEIFVGRNSGIRTSAGDDFVGMLPGQTGAQSRLQDRMTIDAGIGNDQVAMDNGVHFLGTGSVDGNGGVDGLQRGNADAPNAGFFNFESNSVAGLAATMDSIFERLQANEIDPSVFGGPDLIRELTIAASTGNASFTENGGPVLVDSFLEIDGPANAAITSASVAIGSVFASDLLEFTGTTDITGSFDNTTGILSLTGKGNTGDWQSVLRTVRFNNTSNDPNTSNRIITFTINNADDTKSASRTVAVTGNPDPPVLTIGNLSLELDIDAATPQRPLPVAPDATVTDEDTSQFLMTEVIVSITSGVRPGDVLAATDQDGVTSSFDPSTNLLSFTGSASISTLNTILRSVTFDNQNDRAPLGSRTITMSVSDGTLITNRNIVIIVVASLSATVTTTESVVSFTETDPATVVDAGVSIVPATGGVDNTIASATVRIIDGFAAGQDVLEFDAVSGITGTYDETAGVLSFSGSSDFATYQTLLRSVRYANSLELPSLMTGDRTIEFSVVNNGVQASASRVLRVSSASDERLIQNYLDENSLTSQRTDSGLHFIVEQVGNGSFPTANSTVKVNYKGFLLDGSQFDGNDNAEFSLQGVIAGWTEGIPKFSVGGAGQLLIPANLAYGGNPPPGSGIPANAVLRFEVDLLSFV